MAVAVFDPPARWRPTRQVVAAIAATVAIVTLGLTFGVPSVGTETSARAQADHAGIDVDGIVERASHQINRDPSDPSRLYVNDARYAASFDPGGFTVGHVTLALESMSRAGASAAVGDVAWVSKGNIASRTVASGVEERVTAGSGSLEWDVVLASEPVGRGDLRLTARIDGLLADAVGAHGSLALDDLDLGDLVVKDATGVVLHHAAPVVTGDQLTMTVPAAVLDHARYPLTVDPTITSEIYVSNVAGPGPNGFPAIASDGTNLLVTWLGPGGVVMGTRITPLGNILSPGSFTIASGAQLSDPPSVAFGGGKFLVTWTTGPQVRAARVGTGGKVMDPGGFLVSAGTAPDVAFDGTNFLVVWQDGRNANPGDVYGARVNGGGTVLDPAGKPIATGRSSQWVPAVAFNGTNYLVVWEDDRGGTFDVYATRVNKSGAALDGTGVAVSTAGGDQTHPDVSAGGSQYLVVWEDARAGFPQQDVYAARVNTSGGVLDAGGIPVDAASGSHRANPAVAYDGTNYLVTWEETFGPTIDARLVSSSGVPAAAGVEGISSLGGLPESIDVVATSYGWYVVWDGLFESSTHILGNPEVPAANGPAADQLVSGVVPHQGSPDVVAYFVNEFFIVWTDFRNGSDYDVYGTFVNTSGQVFDQDGRAISTAPGNQLDPKAAFDPDQIQLLVVWTDFRNGVLGDVYGARVGTDESSNLAIAASSNGEDGPDVAYANGSYFVVWLGGATCPNSACQVYAGRVRPSDGAQLDPGGFLMSSGSAHAVAQEGDPPSVAVSSSGIAVTWADYRGAHPDIYASRYSGGVVGPVDVLVSTNTTDTSQTNPAIGAVGANWFIAWQDNRNGNLDIYGTRLNGALAVQDLNGVAISTASGTQQTPSVAGGSLYLVVWADRRNGPTWIYGSRVSTTGEVKDPAGLVIESDFVSSFHPSVAWEVHDGLWLVTYARDVPSGAGIFSRQVKPK